MLLDTHHDRSVIVQLLLSLPPCPTYPSRTYNNTRNINPPSPLVPMVAFVVTLSFATSLPSRQFVYNSYTPPPHQPALSRFLLAVRTLQGNNELSRKQDPGAWGQSSGLVDRYDTIWRPLQGKLSQLARTSGRGSVYTIKFHNEADWFRTLTGNVHHCLHNGSGAHSDF